MPSASLIPANDPTLLFTNAGMVPFKNQFIGKEQVVYDRVTSAQHCVRAGGKHNDLENVGYTSRHHTLFEMLGNFSFGAYFKQEAIQYAWTFLTTVLQIPEEKLWITVHQDDDEAAAIWAAMVPTLRILRLGDEENFWMMGPTGPCGPCSEIYYDYGPEVAGGLPGTAEGEGDRYVEIWNLVFMQYEQKADGSRQDLPTPCVDTGMGLERIAAVMQGVQNNYETDLFAPLLRDIQKAAGWQMGNEASCRVIADHIRSASLLIAEAVTPGNEGRGYVLRRIIRRALRHTRQLGIEERFFADLSDRLADMMGDVWPHLLKARKQVQQALLQEAQLFSLTLGQGMGLLEKELIKLRGDRQKQIPGELIFRLYDTYGFPSDLTADIGRERGFSADMRGFDEAMAEQKKRSKLAHRFSEQETAAVGIGLNTDFTGYRHLSGKQISVSGLYEVQKNDARPAISAVSELKTEQQGIVVLACTPFYAEAGGQVGDSGWLRQQGGRFQVLDTTKNGDCHLHHGYVIEGVINAQSQVTAFVDAERRQRIRRNHSATHLLHATLRKVLGDGVVQKGSLVDENKLRFDFSHPQAVTEEEQLQIEQLMNTEIRRNTKVTTEEMAIEAARKQGAVAMFGEKYGEQVRVLTMGEGSFSMELCGGTHVARTGDIGFFCILDESGISAGVRRIEAVTGDRAANMLANWRGQISALQKMLNAEADILIEKVKELQAAQKNMQKEIRRLENAAAVHIVDELVTRAKTVGDARVLVAELKVAKPNEALRFLDELKLKLDKAVILLAFVDNNKVSLVAGVSKSMTDRIEATQLVQVAGEIVGAKGGGRADMARAGGGLQVTKLAAALEKTSALITEKLG